MMGVFGRAASRNAGSATRPGVKKGTRARNKQAEQIVANRSAQGQGLFSADQSTRRAWRRGVNGGSVSMSDTDKINAARNLQSQHSDIANQIRQNNAALRNKENPLSGMDRKQMEMNNKALKEQLGQARSGFRETTSAIDSGAKMTREMTTGERLGSMGGAVKDYYIGGTMGQSAARIGATAGGIVGLNVGMDALDESI